MKIRLLLILKNPFTARDYDRMGIEILRRRFDLTVLDCSPWLMPCTSETRVAATPDHVRLIIVRSMGDLKAFLANERGGFAIDYVGQFSAAAILMFHQLKQAGLKIVAIDSGSFPIPKEWKRPPLTVRQFAYALRSQFIPRAVRGLGRRLLRGILPDQAADIALVAGDSWMTDPRFVCAKTKVPSHSFDYEKFRTLKALPRDEANAPYAVYIDESLSAHEDNQELGYRSPVSHGRFAPALRDFFSRFEAATHLPVRIAGYPSAQRAECKETFGDRIVEFGRTAETIRGAEIILAHASTAISFGVLWRLPIVFLTTPELDESWYFPWVQVSSQVLRRPLVDIEADLPSPDGIASWFILDEQTYANYETTYLRAVDAPDLGLWDIFINSIEAATTEDRKLERIVTG